jgi:hypothetical protein
MELLERQGLFSLHAGCLADDEGRGVLLCGPSGVGKSTLALALARAGMSFLSDDMVFLKRSDEPPLVQALGFADTVGVSVHASTSFPDLHAHLGEPSDGFPKRLSRIEDLVGARAIPECNPQAVVFPDVTHTEYSEIRIVDPGDALIRLAPDVLLTEAAATQAHLAAIAALLDQVRCYTLRSGTDLERAANVVTGVL